MVFWPHQDQEEIITAALDCAKQAVSTQHLTVALEAICQSYMGSGIAFKKWDDALTFYAKGTTDQMAFAEAVISHLEKCLPGIEISAAIAPKKEATTEPATAL
jgi:hypothetical protein